MTNKRLFVSHASEDKSRFVTNFATELRALGVDAWLDMWEIQFGDSLPEKIAQAITQSDGLIAIISQYSLKPWVNLEINTAIVNRIQHDYKIIPVVLDAAEVPPLLKSSLYIRVDDVSSHTEVAVKVVNAIYGFSTKPALGSPPSSIIHPEQQSTSTPNQRHKTYQHLDRTSLEELLTTYQKNLAHVMRQASMSGALEVSVRIKHETDEYLKEIAALKEEINWRD